MLSTVLIIDKRKELSTKYKKCISELNANVTVAKTLKEAMVSVQNLDADMIVVSDSIDEDLSVFCQKLRALTYNTRPIIIALSKSADATDRIKVLENGADDFISEPVNIDEFKFRIKAHLRRDIESNLNTITLLPNYKYTRKALKRVLSTEGQGVLYVSVENLDNYKSVYTELVADKLLQTFVAIAKSTMSETDFIGQMDENVFVIITNKYSAEKMAEFLTFAFDTVVPKFYSQQDVERGYMQLKGERYAGMRVNFVSVLVGGILDDFNLIPNVDALIDRLKTVNKMAKIPNGSNYMIERAKLTASDSVIDDVFNRNIYIKETDGSLAYLIRTSLELQGYDVQDDLDIKSAIQPSIIIMDSKDDLSNLEFLRTLKNMQSFSNTKVIVTTNIHDKSAILGAGADLYLPKPYEISDLIRWVEYFLKKQ